MVELEGTPIIESTTLTNKRSLELSESLPKRIHAKLSLFLNTLRVLRVPFPVVFPKLFFGSILPRHTYLWSEWLDSNQRSSCVQGRRDDQTSPHSGETYEIRTRDLFLDREAC